jgi:hypothetical protein
MSTYPKDFFGNSNIRPVKGECFVLMPFADNFLPVYDTIKNTIESNELNMRCHRADDLTGGGYIIQSILHSIGVSDFIIADLTDKNPNVFYELGIAHMAKDYEKVILLTQDMDFVPFDLRQFRCIVYQQTPAGQYNLKSKIIETLKYLTRGQYRYVISEGQSFLIPRRFRGQDRYLYELEYHMGAIGESDAKGELKIYRLDSVGSREVIFNQGIMLGVTYSRKLEEFNLPLKYEIRLEKVLNRDAIFLVTQTDTID